MSERRWSWNKVKDILAWAAFGYVIFVRSVIIIWDARLGYPLHQVGGGKARGEYGAIEEFALLFGVWATLLALWLIVRFAWRVFTEPEIERKVICVIVVFSCCLLLYLN